MTSYALSLTVVVVDPRRLDLVCLENGGKQAGKPADQRRYRDEYDKNNVAHISRMKVSLAPRLIYSDP